MLPRQNCQRATCSFAQIVAHHDYLFLAQQQHFFSEGVVNVWDSLPKDVDFSSRFKFRRSILRVSFYGFIKYS